jgi:hypothetical protein
MKRLNRSLKSILIASVFAGVMVGNPINLSSSPTPENSNIDSLIIKKKYDRIMQKFQIGLEDSLLDIDEQKEISIIYASLRNFNDTFCPNLDITPEIGIYHQIGKYTSLLEKNVNGIDFGQPELEKEFYKRGLSRVSVERTTSDTESVFYGILGLFAVTGSLASYIKRKR